MVQCNTVITSVHQQLSSFGLNCQYKNLMESFGELDLVWELLETYVSHLHLVYIIIHVDISL